MASYVEQLANGSFYDYVMKETVRCAVNVNNERDSMLTADKVRAFCCRRVIVSRHQNCCSRSEVEDLGLEILNKAVSRNGCKKLKSMIQGNYLADQNRHGHGFKFRSAMEMVTVAV